jgi:hypothetical protein
MMEIEQFDGTEVKLIADEEFAKKFRHLRLDILIIAVSLVVVLLFSLLVVVIPLTFGDQFVSPSFEVLKFAGNRMDVVSVNGSVVHISMASFMVSAVNNYFLPVYVHYNGFEVVILIYNRSIAEPADVVANKDFLVGGVFLSDHLPGWYPISTFDDNIGASTAYEYYIARKDLSNYTREIPVAGAGGFLIGDPSVDGAGWYGQNSFSDKPVSPGTYYIHCTAFGQAARPLNLTVISVLWT